jgi:hypothetical protein
MISRPIGELAAYALICTDCGYVERFVRDPRQLQEIDGVAIVHARANPPYR